MLQQTLERNIMPALCPKCGSNLAVILGMLKTDSSSDNYQTAAWILDHCHTCQQWVISHLLGEERFQMWLDKSGLVDERNPLINYRTEELNTELKRRGQVRTSHVCSKCEYEDEIEPPELLLVMEEQ